MFLNHIVFHLWNLGDTVNEKFKIDLRLCLLINNKNYDISNIEFKRTGNEARLVREDQSKVLSEGKLILNQLCKNQNLSFEEAKEKIVIVGQVCGNIYNLKSSNGLITVSLLLFFRLKSRLS